MKLLKFNQLSVFSSQHVVRRDNFLSTKGFTLIELLVVIAVIAVLAAIVLLAVNPGEQLARGRDTSRQSAVTQLGRSLQAYYTAQGATYFVASTDWMQSLLTSADLKTKVGNIGYTIIPAVNCPAANQQTTGVTNGNGGGYCYKPNATNSEAIVYVRMESALNNNKCTLPAVAWFAFSTLNARAGIVCNSADLTVVSQTFVQ